MTFLNHGIPVTALAVLVGLTAVALPAQPQELNTITVELETLEGGFTTIAAALLASELNTALAGSGPFTVFAPSDIAFANLPAGTVESLLEPQNRGTLTNILTYHVVPGRITSFDLSPGQSVEVTTLAGIPLQVEVDASGGITVNGANVISADIPASNGVIHAVDGVLLP